MGARGPAPTPSAILKMRGSWRGKKNPKEPISAGKPSVPPWLCHSGRALWRSIVPELEDMGILSKVDRNALGRYCELSSLFTEALRQVRSGGVTCDIRNAEGMVIGTGVNANFRALESLAAQLGRLEAVFGLTPSARTRLEAVNAPIQERQATIRKQRLLDAQ